MESVLVACRKQSDFEKINKAVKKHFKVIHISSAEILKKLENKFDLILLDHGFTDHSGIDFLMDINTNKTIPTLFLTPDNDPQCAVEALRAGAFNYVVKTGNYETILNIAIRDAISKFSERLELKGKISELKQKLNQFEENQGRSNRDEPAPQPKYVSIKDAGFQEKPKKEINLVEEIISRFKKGEINLPSLPQIYVKFNKLISQGANINELAKLLKQDVAIASTLINISNTAFYKGMETNKTLEDAISRLGLGTTRQYVEVISNRSLYTSQNKRYAKIMEKLWTHSLSCAFAAEYLTTLLSLKTTNDTFTLGLIHDIGKLVLLQIIGELEIKGKFNGSLEDNQLFSTLKAFHGRFGAVLLKRWSFSNDHIQIALYHDTIEEVKSPSTEFLIIHFANILVNSMGFSTQEEPEINLEESKSCYLLRLRPNEIEQTKQKVQEYITGIKGVF